MTKQELLARLKEIKDRSGDIEIDHINADNALLVYINDDEVTEAWNDIIKWYA